jgi:DNA-binding NtrC family response regulator
METANATAMVKEQHHACVSHPNVEDSTRRLLIVSSAAQDRRVLGRMLAAHTCPQIWAASMREATDWLNRGGAQVVICDDRLPDGLWHELWEQLRRRPDPPVFIVSAAWNDAGLWAEVLNLGAYDVLVKPYQKSEVTRILQHACRRIGYLA